MTTIADLLERPVYAIPQVDGLLGLNPGTARRWIEGYRRGSKAYPPIVRIEATADDSVTWGEFVETRLLREYRDLGAHVRLMRPAVEKLREEFNTKYPLAYARPYLDVDGRELVRRIQDEVHLDKRVTLVTVRNNQLILTPQAERFVSSVDFHATEGIVERVHPAPDLKEVAMDPLRQFGEPVVRSVRTDIIAEQMRAGDSMEMIAELYELSSIQVEAAVRFELIRGKPVMETAA